MKGMMRFGKKGKLTPRYIGPFEILERIGEVIYCLALPPQLANVHSVFHVSMLKKYEPDPTNIINWEQIQLRDNATYSEELVQILDRKEQILRTKTIPLVKILWSHHNVEEATWEREDEIRERHPELFCEE
ncbi:uncharacterized protein LOC131239044 [Magnolia sinica]|uniref:uncharacterized protein LOC131239044 n=1 Tax=Magnolia sinica TaxID=86752 RepID=UPI0026588E51|nr:uncharacterized protein LOC131239044 [Magnolia sinica]